MGIFDKIKEFFQGINLALMPKSVESLDKRRETILDEIYLAEKRMLRKEISEEKFVEIREGNLEELVTVVAEISTKKIEGEIDRIAAGETGKLSPGRRKVLSELLKEKELIVKELDLAGKKYSEQKFDAKRYRSLIGEKNREMIALELKIKQVFREEAKEIMKRAEEILAGSEERKLTLHADEIAEEIYRQIPISDEPIDKKSVVHERPAYVPRRKRRKH